MGHTFDLLLFGNEAADTGEYQVGIRVAHALGWPCVTGIKALAVEQGTATARREAAGGWETFALPLPAVITVKEGLNLPRYVTVPGRLKAKRAPIEAITPRRSGSGNGSLGAVRKVRLRLPPEKGHKGEVLGRGPEAAPRLVEVLQQRGIIGS
jgi:electron transfer flavoprotein beta subunit